MITHEGQGDVIGHTMIYRDEQTGRYGLTDCTCGEDHGPSLREELLIVEQVLADVRAELEVVKAERDAQRRAAGLALRRLAFLRRRGASS